jgi:hypothetical protein
MKRAIEMMHRSGDVFYNPIYKTYNPTSGYMVLIEGYGRVTQNESHIEHMANTVAVNIPYLLKKLEERNVYVNLWYYKGKYYAGTSVNVQGLDDAISLAKDYGQTEIFNCEKKETILL